MSKRAFHTFKILPRNGRIAWLRRSRPCLAEPPAESPSTRNNSVSAGSSLVQSASLPGNAGPDVSFLRTTFLAERMRRAALPMQCWASNSASSVCSLSHRLKLSLTTPEIKAAASREDNRSLVCPENWGSCSLTEST